MVNEQSLMRSVFERKTDLEIAALCNVSPATSKYWLKYGVSLHRQEEVWRKLLGALDRKILRLLTVVRPQICRMAGLNHEEMVEVIDWRAIVLGLADRLDAAADRREAKAHSRGGEK